MDMTVLLGVVVVLRGVSGAAVVTAGAGADREVCVGAVMSLDSRVLKYFPVRVISEVVVIVRKGNRDEGELELLREPTRGSRDSSEHFIIVGRGEGEVSFDIMGNTSSDHSATFSCLDRVIVASGS